MCKVVEYGGALYSLSNRRLFMFRVVANYKYGAYHVKATVYPMQHPRIQDRRYDARLQRFESKWRRAFSTTCDGAWVHVESEYRWKQEAPPAYEYVAERKRLSCIPEGEEEPLAKPGARPEQKVPPEMLFELPWCGDYAMALGRLCKEYGVIEGSPDCVVSASGKKVTLIFCEQPQLIPDVEKIDFPLAVWRVWLDGEVPGAMAGDGREQEVNDGEEDGQEQEQGLHEQQVEEASQEEQISLPTGSFGKDDAAMEDAAPVTPSTASPSSTQYGSECDPSSDCDLGPVEKSADHPWKRWNKMRNQNREYPNRWNKMAK